MEPLDLKFKYARIEREHTDSYMTIEFLEPALAENVHDYVAGFYPGWEIVCCMFELDEMEEDYIDRWETE